MQAVPRAHLPIQSRNHVVPPHGNELPYLETLVWNTERAHTAVIYKSTETGNPNEPPEYASVLFAALPALVRILFPPRPVQHTLGKVAVPDDRNVCTLYTRGADGEIAACEHQRDENAWRLVEGTSNRARARGRKPASSRMCTPTLSF